MKISIIIPVFNEAAHRRCGHRQGARASIFGGRDLEKEIIVVNDGSSDGTREALAPYEKLAGVRVHHSPVNLGKGSSVRIGFSFAHRRHHHHPGRRPRARSRRVQAPDPADPRRLGRRGLRLALRSARGKKGKLSFWIANKALATLTNTLYRASLTDIETCYKVFRADVIPQLKLKAARFEIEPELTAQLLKRGFRIKELPIGYAPRTHDEGKKINWKDGFGAVWMLVTQRLDK